MGNRAVFMDRDKTLIEDPGYIAEPSVVKLLPGVDLALKWLAQAGYKLIVVTNQSGVARGLISEAQLQQVHQELLRQLQDKGAHLDAIYYCPYHPEGNVEPYAIDSDLRKPAPGMLLEAARQWELDLGRSWMVGDGARDIEAGQRAGCRTIRLRSGPEDYEQEIQAAAADFTARNLVEAAKIVLQQDRQGASGASPAPAAEQTHPVQARQAGSHVSAAQAAAPPNAPIVSQEAPQAPQQSVSQASRDKEPAAGSVSQPGGDQQFRRELLGYVRQIARGGAQEEFNPARLLGGIVQVLALLGLMMTLWNMLDQRTTAALLWGQVTMIGQLLALTLFVLARR